MSGFASKLRALIGGGRKAAPKAVDPGSLIEQGLFRPGWRPFVVQDGGALRVLLAPENAPVIGLLKSGKPRALLQALERGEIDRILVRKLRARGTGSAVDVSHLLPWLMANPGPAFELAYRLPRDGAGTAHGAFTSVLQLQNDSELALFSNGARGDAAPVQPASAPPDWGLAQAALEQLDGRVLWAHLKAQALTLIPVPTALQDQLGQLSPPAEDILAAVRGGGVVDLVDPALAGAGGEPLFSAAQQTAVVSGLASDPERMLRLMGSRLVVRLPLTGLPRLHAPLGDAEALRRHAVMLVGSRAPQLIPLLALVAGKAGDPAVAEYHLPPAKAEPAAKRRSVLFLHQCYYNFTYLAKALRDRGWDAVSLTMTDINGPAAQLYHGVDVSLYDPNPAVAAANIRSFFETVPERFGIVHSYGRGAFTFFPQHNDANLTFDHIPWDMLDLKARGVLLGYSHNGCLDMVSQSTFGEWSPDACERCVWRTRPDVCSDAGNLAWGWKMRSLADLICIETEPTFDFKGSAQAFRDPLTFALDPEVWRPDLVPPPHLVRPREPGEVIVFHAVGNYRSRTLDGVNIKGTHAVMEAIDRLRAEGHRVRLDFVHDVPSIDMRYVQVQADILVDQLNYGRYGASAREGMMLGKPVIGRINKTEPDGRPPSDCIVETPIVDANEDTFYEVLKGLVVDAGLRARIGETSRAHAVPWSSAPVLAERFERVYDAIRDTGRVPAGLD